MRWIGKSYPMRAIARHKALYKLKIDLATAHPPQPLDEALFREIAATLSHPNRIPEFDRECATRAEADAIENRIATELTETYKQIKQRQQDAIVQNLNDLL
jgi:DNA polymerase III delta subunit